MINYAVPPGGKIAKSQGYPFYQLVMPYQGLVSSGQVEGGAHKPGLYKAL